MIQDRTHIVDAEMKISFRLYSGSADQPAMLALAQACFTENLHVVDMLYRLSSWALDDPENVGLWVDAHRKLIAWGAMQAPFGRYIM